MARRQRQMCIRDRADVMRDKLKEIGLLIKDGDDNSWYWENS